MTLRETIKKHLSEVDHKEYKNAAIHVKVLLVLLEKAEKSLICDYVYDLFCCDACKFSTEIKEILDTPESKKK